MQILADWWRVIAAAAALSLMIPAAIHAILYKRDARAAVGWLGFIWLAPVAGALCYYAFGVNRVQRRAVRLGRRRATVERHECVEACPSSELTRVLASRHHHLEPLARAGDAVLRRHLLHGNVVRPLINGEETLDAMIQAIDASKQSILLVMYIFDLDEVGRRFVDALARAQARGAHVRVLLDDVGRGRWPSPLRALRKAGVRVERFLPALIPWRGAFLHLRNHRKILVCDGRIGFTGGINISARHLVRSPGPRVEDVHFRIEGPVVNQLQEAAAEDWAFATDEILAGDAWFPLLEPSGPTIARGIPVDPGGHFEKLKWTLLSAISVATTRVRIVTPYFIPDAPLVAALNVASYRGVDVDIVLPAESDTRLVDWASSAMLWQVLVGGCRVWRTPAPFDHAKLMVVDGAWTLFGSANMDPRSLRLNFEYNVECYDPHLAATVDRLIDARIERARRVTLKEMDGRSLPVRLRDGLARLLSPYL